MAVQDTKGLSDRIKVSIKKGDISKAFEIIVTGFKKDSKNIALINNFEEEFKSVGLSKELIELYRTEFYYTSEPKVLEKIGDIYFGLKDYESALNSYFDCAEVSENYPEIYQKLAQTFAELGDKESEQACLDQVALLSKKSK